MTKKNKRLGQYYLGLDIGTSSVGWAVTDHNYKVIRKNGKDLWGVRLFEEAQTAKDRRLHRSARRRNDRKKQRLALLQELFDAEITKIDPDFFFRLSESKYWLDDKKVEGKDTLFHDPGFSDREYHRKFPTIYHLRDYLMKSDEKEDIRLYYLAVAHIIKNRGHFLISGDVGSSSETNVEHMLDLLKEQMIEDYDWDEDWDTCEVAAILKDRKLLVKEKNLKWKKMKSISGSPIMSWFEMLGGKTCKLKNLYPELDQTEIGDEKIDGKKFSSEKVDELAEKLNDQQHSLLTRALYVKNAVLLNEILPNGKGLSESKVDVYKKHKQDLSDLKSLVKRFCPEKKDRIFRQTDLKSNYCNYTGSSEVKGQRKNVSKCSQDEFYTFLKAELKEVLEQDDENVQKVKREIDAGTFLPLLRVKDNNVIPFQIHKNELCKILDKMEVHYPFLTEEDENHQTTREKIIRLLTFRIPYFVGPLNDRHKKEGREGFCWLVKKDSNVPITPFNFEQIVDLDASEEKFIERLKSTCTYLVGEEVLPESSLLYSRFKVLNELNNLRINGKPISVELKQQLYNRLFLQTDCSPEDIKPAAKITLSKLVAALKSLGIKNIKKESITGIDGGFQSNLETELSFRKIFPQGLDSALIEKCIFALTVCEDPTRKKRKIEALLEGASPEQIKSVVRIKTGKWGRLSAKLLTGLYGLHSETGQKLSIIEWMWETNENLMQVLSSDRPFIAQITAYNRQQNAEDSEESWESRIEQMHLSPAVNRSLIQTIKVVEEITKITGSAPEKIFVEMARGGDSSTSKTDSRKDKLLKLYKEKQKELRDWKINGAFKELEGTSNEELRNRRLFLYFMQLGRCAYSGEKINLNALLSRDPSGRLYYDLDHIYPKSKTMDDSLDNLVLVRWDLNRDIKGDKYPVAPCCRQPKLWYTLVSLGFMSKVKYERLMRNYPLTEEELAGFINRQLVETRQSSKAAASLLKSMYPESEIVYVKAHLASEFRNEYGLVKVRELNDYHHAKDAYLNVVVGNVYNEKFTNNPLNFIKKNAGKPYSLKIKTLFGANLNGKNRQVIWLGGEDGSLAVVKKQMSKNTILVSRKVKTSSGNGQLWDENPVSRSKSEGCNGTSKVRPLKGSDSRLANVERYGGYKKIKNYALALVEKTSVTGKGKKAQQKKERLLQPIPLYMYGQYHHNPDFQREYFEKILGTSVKVIIPEIMQNSRFILDDCDLIYTAISDGRLVLNHNIQAVFKAEEEKYLKRIVSVNSQLEGNKNFKVSEKFDQVSKSENLSLYRSMIAKLESRAYASFSENEADDLKKREDIFISLTIEDQIRQLYNILLYFQCNSKTLDTVLLKGNKKARIRRPYSLRGYSKAELVTQSVTGFFEKHIDLLGS